MYNLPPKFSTKISSKISDGAEITTFSSDAFTTSASMDCATLISSKFILNSLSVIGPFPSFGVVKNEIPPSDLMLQEKIVMAETASRASVFMEWDFILV